MFKKLAKITSKQKDEEKNLNKMLLRADGSLIATNGLILAAVKNMENRPNKDVLINNTIKDDLLYTSYISQESPDDYPDSVCELVDTPKDEKKPSTRLNVKALKDLLSVFENTDDIDIYIDNPDKPVVIEKVKKEKNKNDYEISGAIAPIY